MKYLLLGFIGVFLACSSQKKTQESLEEELLRLSGISIIDTTDTDGWYDRVLNAGGWIDTIPTMTLDSSFKYDTTLEIFRWWSRITSISRSDLYSNIDTFVVVYDTVPGISICYDTANSKCWGNSPFPDRIEIYGVRSYRIGTYIEPGFFYSFSTYHFGNTKEFRGKFYQEISSKIYQRDYQTEIKNIIYFKETEW